MNTRIVFFEKLQDITEDVKGYSTMELTELEPRTPIMLHIGDDSKRFKLNVEYDIKDKTVLVGKQTKSMETLSVTLR